MDFVVDENIPVELIPWLQEKGHKIISVPKGTPDEKVASIVKRHHGILLTQNRHFTNILRFPPQNLPGIIRIKIHPSYIADIIPSLEKLLKAFPAQEDFKGKLIILEKEGFFKLKE